MTPRTECKRAHGRLQLPTMGSPCQAYTVGIGRLALDGGRFLAVHDVLFTRSPGRQRGAV
eukprot:scaffold336_cov384-Prasinococcus_capsulatus_cf.AAC.32